MSTLTAPRTLIWQSMHDVGVATWFGSSVWNAVAPPLPHGEAPMEATPAVAAVMEAEEKHRFRPIEYGAIALTLVSAVGLGIATRGQRHPGTAAAHIVLTGAAVGTSIWSRIVARRLEDAERIAASTVGVPPRVDPDSTPLTVVPESKGRASWPGDREGMEWPDEGQFDTDEFMVTETMPTPLDEAISLERTARLASWATAGLTGAILALDALSHARARRILADPTRYSPRSDSEYAA